MGWDSGRASRIFSRFTNFASISFFASFFLISSALISSAQSKPTSEDFLNFMLFQQWSLEAIQAGPARQVAYSTPGASPILIAVSDTGLDRTHPYLKPNIFPNPFETHSQARAGIDDDSNGFIDDFFGWNFAEQNNNTDDDFNHGTHVAGIIGAKENSQIDMAGVNPRALLLPIKWMKEGSGWPADAVQSIEYAIQMKAKILNASWGGIGRTEALLNAVKKAERAGMIIVASAGNTKNNNDQNPRHPSFLTTEFSNVISVANSNTQDQLDPTSNFGTTTVDIAAPGVKILSTYPNSRYAELSGTSMATAIVSGVASLMLTANPKLNPSEIKTILCQTAEPILGAQGKLKCPGRIHALRAVEAAKKLKGNSNEN